LQQSNKALPSFFKKPDRAFFVAYDVNSGYGYTQEPTPQSILMVYLNAIKTIRVVNRPSKNWVGNFYTLFFVFFLGKV